MKTTRSLGTVAAVVLLSALSACGGSDQGADSPEDAVSTVLLAGLDKDAETVCANSLSDEGKVPSEKKLETCEKEVQAAMDANDEALEQLDAEQQKQRESDEKDARKIFEAKPKKVGKEQDGVVKVTYSFQGADQELSAKKVDGRWYFAG